MNIFSRLFRRSPARRKQAAGTQSLPWFANWFEGGLSSKAKYSEIVQEAYYSNAVAYRCIGLLAQSVAYLPIITYRGEREVADHWVANLLSRPNILENRYDFFERLVILLMLGGSSYVLARGIYEQQRPKEMWSILPHHIQVFRQSGAMLPSRYEYQGPGGMESFPFDEIYGRCDLIQIAKPDPLSATGDPGFSPTLAAGPEIDIRNEGSRWNYNLLKNTARPPGALSMPADQPPLDEQQFQRLKDEIKREVSGAEKAGEPLLLEGGLTWQEMGKGPAELDWNNSRIQLARDICMIYGVPAQMVGIPDTQTYSNYREARQSFYEETAIPLGDKIINALEAAFNKVLPRNQQISLEIDKDQVDALAPKRQAHWDRVESSTVLTINEKREELGFEPIDGGDQLYQSPNQVPLDMLAAGIGAEMGSGGGQASQDGPLETREGINLVMRVLQRMQNRELSEDEAAREIARQMGITVAGAQAVMDEVQDYGVS